MYVKQSTKYIQLTCGYAFEIQGTGQACRL